MDFCLEQLDSPVWKVLSIPRNSYVTVDKQDPFYGIEIEVENYSNIETIPSEYEYNWLVKEDGSLRNNGKELVSIPIKFSEIKQNLDYIYSSLSPDVSWSPRTSIHIHQNFRFKKVSELFSLLYLYTVFELSFFRFVGKNRKESIYCVPLIDSNLLNNLDWRLQKNSIRWKKYTALNLLRLKDLGTVEYRHLYGTSDKDKIYLWISIINCLIKYINNTDNYKLMEIISNLNSNSLYEIFHKEVFDSNHDKLWDNHLSPYEMEETTSFLKSRVFLSDFSRDLLSGKSFVGSKYFIEYGGRF